MKIIKIMIILSMMIISSQAEDNYEDYVKEMLEYKIKLPKELYNPFIVKVPQIKKAVVKKVTKIKKVIKEPQKKTDDIKKEVTKIIVKETPIYLMAILNNQALVKTGSLNMGKWLGVGDEIDNYVLKRIINNDTILVEINDNTKMIKMKENNIIIKVK